MTFKKQLAGKKAERPIDPVKLLTPLIARTTRGRCGPPSAQRRRIALPVHREQKDVIVKLHTRQGKTLIDLLVLHSRHNNGKGPAI